MDHVSIREVGPRDGFQNEPEVIPTAEKVRLIDLLARTGLTRLEVTSFVRAAVIPQLADAAEVLERIDPPDGREPLRADPEREGPRERAAPARPLPGDQRLPERVGDPQPQETSTARSRSRWPGWSGCSPAPGRKASAARA
jgi:hydroxymethylglutaryl-CoA lyase